MDESRAHGNERGSYRFRWMAGNIFGRPKAKLHAKHVCLMTGQRLDDESMHTATILESKADISLKYA